MESLIPILSLSSSRRIKDVESNTRAVSVTEQVAVRNDTLKLLGSLKILKE
jgi:hypothetical protein